MKPIPLFDCHLPELALASLENPFRLGQLASGPAVLQLEQFMDARFEGRHSLAVSDLTHGLALALRLANVKPGDEVLSLSFNCMSSNTAITMVGAQAVWVDVDAETASFDVDHAKSCLTSRTKAVVVYHVSGYPAQLSEIRKFCDEHSLVLIEDANNSFGATVNDQMVGTVGDLAVFSLYANRQINAVDGGILLCRYRDAAERAKRLRRFGLDLNIFRDQDGEINPSVDVPEVGLSASLNNVHATIGLISAADVDERIAQSTKNASKLAEATRHLALKPISPVGGGNPVYWTWMILLPERNRVMRELKASGIMCSKLHHPSHHYSGFSARPQKLPGTETLENQLLAVPCGWWIDDGNISQIVEAFERALKE